MGTGIRHIEKIIREVGLQPVRYRWDDFVTVIFPLVKEKTSGKIVEIILSNPDITIPELSAMVGITERSVERNLQKLQRE